MPCLNGHMHDSRLKSQLCSDSLRQDEYCACFEINFSDRQKGLMVFSVICDHGLQFNIVVLECHYGWPLLKSEMTLCDCRLRVDQVCPNSGLGQAVTEIEQPCFLFGDAWSFSWLV